MIHKKFRDIFYIVIITSVVILISSGLLLEFEMYLNPEINNFFDALWLTVVTITSLGYGDSYPITDPGRIVAIFLMFYSIFLVGSIAGIVSHDFIDKSKKKKNRN